MCIIEFVTPKPNRTSSSSSLLFVSRSWNLRRCFSMYQLCEPPFLQALYTRRIYSYAYLLISLAFFGVISYCWLVHSESQFNISTIIQTTVYWLSGEKAFHRRALHSDDSRALLWQNHYIPSVSECVSFQFQNWHIGNGNKFLAHIKRKISIFYVLCVWIKMGMTLMQHSQSLDLSMLKLVLSRYISVSVCRCFHCCCCCCSTIHCVHLWIHKLFGWRQKVLNQPKFPFTQFGAHLMRVRNMNGNWFNISSGNDDSFNGRNGGEQLHRYQWYHKLLKLPKKILECYFGLGV